MAPQVLPKTLSIFLVRDYLLGATRHRAVHFAGGGGAAAVAALHMIIEDFFPAVVGGTMTLDQALLFHAVASDVLEGGTRRTLGNAPDADQEIGLLRRLDLWAQPDLRLLTG